MRIMFYDNSKVLLHTDSNTFRSWTEKSASVPQSGSNKEQRPIRSPRSLDEAGEHAIPPMFFV